MMASDFTPPLSMLCSDFRKTVWEVMLSIPYGQHDDLRGDSGKNCKGKKA